MSQACWQRGSRNDDQLTDAKGVPLAVSLTKANRHDVTQWLPFVDVPQSVKNSRRLEPFRDALEA